MRTVRGRTTGSKRQRGVALLVVLWGSTLAAIVLGALAINAHVEGLQARAQLDQTQAFYAAQAGLERAVVGLRLRDDNRRWVPDGRPYELSVGDIRVQVSVMDDDGKINLNQAGTATLGKLLAAAGADPQRTAGIVDAMTRWGAVTAGTNTPDFLAAGGFVSIEEVQRLPGMDPELYHRIEPALTLWQMGSGANMAHASALVVAAVSGVPLEQANAFVKARSELSGSSMRLPPLVGPMPASGGFGMSGIVSVSSRAMLADGVATRLRVTLHLIDEPGERRTYRVLRWQVDAGS